MIEGETRPADIPLSENRLPNPPALVAPANNATSQPTSLQLAWTCNDPDGDPLTYDVYADTLTPPQKVVVSNLSEPRYFLRSLAVNKTYFWTVVAKDNKGGIMSGMEWKFATSSVLITDGLAAYYPFNGNVNDESGNGNHGNVFGAALTTDRFGKVNSAYNFDGVNDYIQVQNSNSLNSITEEYTICGWIKPMALYSEWITVLTKGNSTSTKTHYSVAYHSNSFHPELRITDLNNQSVIRYVDITNCLDFGKWTFFCWKFKRGAFEFYKNDIALGSYNTGVTSLLQNGLPLEIGRDAPGQLEFLNGMLDDLRIYNRALTDSEIQTLYREGN